jgi:two-component sensor histidine kinase
VIGGKVTIAAQVAGDDLRLSWSESGGPPVAPPTRKGFGTTLICEVPRRYFGGSAEIDYAPAGVVWTLVAPLAMIVPRGDVDEVMSA